MVIINESKTAPTTSRIFHRICLMRLLLPLSKVITRDIFASMGWRKVIGAGSSGKSPSHLPRIRGIVPFLGEPFGYVKAASTEMPTGDGIRLRIGIGRRS